MIRSLQAIPSNEVETNNLTLYKNGVKYYRTGDKGHIGENGCVYIVDRYKRVMMRPDGHTVHAIPIENAIMEYDAVENCAVVGIPIDLNAGVIPTAFVKLNDKAVNVTKIIDEIDQFCLRRIPERDRALAYVLVEELPYTLMGKVDYRKLEEKGFEELNVCFVRDPLIQKNRIKTI